jgi:hypothetical protein
MPVPEREYFKDFLRYYIATHGGLLRNPETGTRRKSPVSIGRALAKVRCCVVFFLGGWSSSSFESTGFLHFVNRG